MNFDASAGHYRASVLLLLLLVLTCLTLCRGTADASNSMSDAKRLFNRLLNPNVYKSYVRPVTNHSQPILLYMNLSLVQILDVDEKNQIVTLNMWVFQQWHDPNFIWDPEQYDNIRVMHIPSEQIWTPDLVLYNNAGGDWDLRSSANKVSVFSDGTVQWKPPIIFKSQCDINVEFFPFDTQNCTLKLGTWTHNGFLIDLRHVAQMEEARTSSRVNFDNCQAVIDYAVDLSQFVENGEWDILGIRAVGSRSPQPAGHQSAFSLRRRVLPRPSDLRAGRRPKHR